MKSVLKFSLVIPLILGFTSCRTPAPEPFVREDYSEGILVFLDSGFFAKEFERSDSVSSKRKKEKIKDFAKNKLNKLDLNLDNIHVENSPWFFVDKLTEKQLSKIESNPDKAIVGHFPNYELELQGRKPMMQSNPILQGRKPQMQGDWRYDSAKYASELVLWVKEGTEGLPPPNPKTLWIMDSGIDSTHQDLKGVVDKTREYDAFGGNAYLDENGHGTLIAGIIGARAYNESQGNPSDIGINGIYPGATLVSVKVLDSTGTSNLNRLSKALDYLDLHAKPNDIINISLGKEINNNCTWGPLKAKLQKIANKGIYIVFSAGNDAGLNRENFPSCLADGDFMLSVGSMNLFCSDHTMVFSSFSNYGLNGNASNPKPIWIAPGELVFSTYTTTQVGGTDRGVYGLASGTSFSAALMSGLIYRLNGKPSGSIQLNRGGDTLLLYPVVKAGN